MYGRKFYRRRPRKYLRKRKATGRKSRVSVRIRRYVKNAIHRQIENKERILYQSNQSVTTSDRATTTYPLIPGFSNGTDNYTRVGNALKIVKGIFRCTVNLRPYNVSDNPYAQPTWVRVMVVRDLKNAGQLTTMDSAAYARLFRGNGTGLGFQGDCLDLTLPINQDYFRVLYSKCFKLGITNHVSGATNPSSYFDNSPMAKMLTFNWGKWCKKLLKFDDGNTQAINDNLYFVIQGVAADGTSTTGKTPIEFHYTNVVEFEDA